MQTDTPFGYSKDRAAIYNICVCIYAYVHTACVNKTGTQLDHLCFQGNSKHHTTHTSQTMFPERGFLSHLAFVEPELILPVTAAACASWQAFSWHFTNAHNSLSSFPPLPFSSHGYMNERLLHALKSLFRLSTRLIANSLGQSNMYLSTVWSQKWLIAYEFVRLPLFIVCYRHSNFHSY